MRISILLTLLCNLLFATNIHAQQQSIVLKGQVLDTFNNETVQYASVVALRAKDSILLGFTRSDVDGKFSINVPTTEKYKLLVSAYGFADFSETISRGERTEIDLGDIKLYTREKVLKEFVLLQRRGAILIKGDTTEYVADSFKLDANANVEDLLKKLPGLQVDKNGQITAQGEKVKKILVDGEEFFSDDPAVVNRNLQAKTIDKVQVFEKKSESTTFTGIEDGQTEKTINLQLKDKYKNGYFGKIITGGGNDGYFENQGMFNYFKGKMKLSFFGIASNTSRIGLSNEDNSKFGSGGNMVTDEASGISFMTNGDDDYWSGQYNGQGLPKAWSAGLHFSNKWNENKHTVNGNYRFSRNNIETINNNLTQYNLPDSAYYTDQRSNAFRSTDKHSINGRYEWNIDSLNNITVRAKGSRESFVSTNQTTSENKGGSGSLMNRSERINNATGTTDQSNVSVYWKKRFRKKGRSLMLEANLNTQHQEQDGYLNANNAFYSNASVDSTNNVNQLKTKEQERISTSAEITYTEPIAKKTFLEFKYKFNHQDNYSKQLSFNKNALGQYTDLDSTFSSNYDYLINSHRAGATIRWVFEKINFSVGTALSSVELNQKDNFFDNSRKRQFNNFFPSANLRYKVSQNANLTFNYNGSTATPTLEQIQPLRQNIDPLNISLGNPNLGQKFSNTFNIQYNSYQILKGTYYYAGAGGNIIADDISRAEFLSESGIRTYQYINVDGNYNLYYYGGLGKRIAKYDLDLGLNSSINYAHQNSIVNSLSNQSNNTSYALSGNIAHSKDKKWNVSYKPQVTYNDNNNSINNINTSFWSTNHEVDVNVYLPAKFRIGSNINWLIRQRTQVFDRNNNVILWNAYLSKKFLKNENLEAQISANDILNRNLGFSQYGTGNMVMQQNYNTIRRYLMLTLTWNFNNQAKETAAPASDIIDIK